MAIFTKERQLTPSWDLVAPSVELLKKYIWHVLYLSFLPTLLTVVALTLFGGLDGRVEPITTFELRHSVGAILLVLSIIWALLAMPAFIYLQVEAIKGNMPSIMDCYRKGLRYLLPLIGMYILSTLLIVVGLIALIIPGLFLIRGFLLSPYYLVGKNLGPVEALKQSYQDSRKVSAYIWGVIGVTLLFSLMGSLFGLIPVVGTLLSQGIRYIYIFANPLRYGEVVNEKALKLSA